MDNVFFIAIELTVSHSAKKKNMTNSRRLPGLSDNESHRRGLVKKYV